MYGPAARCKRFVNLADAVLHQCIRPLIGACCAPGHHGYQRAFELISGQASNGPFGSPVFACAGKTDPPSSSHPLADLGGYSGRRLADPQAGIVRKIRGEGASLRSIADLVLQVAGLMVAAELAERRLVQLKQNLAQHLRRWKEAPK